MTEKLVAWFCLALLALFVVTFASHQRLSLDARPVLTAVQYIGVWTGR